MASFLLTLALACLSAWVTIVVGVDPNWAKGHPWLQPGLLWFGVGLLALAGLAWLFRRPRHTLEKPTEGNALQTVSGGTGSPINIGSIGPGAHVHFGDNEKPEVPEKPALGKPHFEVMQVGIQRVLHLSDHPREGVIEVSPGLETEGFTAVTAKIENRPVAGESARAMDVIARIRYYSEDWTRTADLDYGVWVNSPCESTHMNVGDTGEVVLLGRLDDHVLYAFDDLRRNRVSGDYLRPIPVEWFRYISIIVTDRRSHVSSAFHFRMWWCATAWCSNPISAETIPANVRPR